MENNNLFHERQHGFRTRRSCETQLLEFVNEAHASGNRIDAIVMDFSKAFDKVSHPHLAVKLQRYGVSEQARRWIASFLSDRTQQVVVEGEASTPRPCSSGVPQGSVIGPALFLVFINDLPDWVKSETRLFADDTIVYRIIKSKPDEEQLQQDLVSLEQWEATWLMEFHPKKCVVLSLNNARQKTAPPEYKLHGHILEVVPQAKYLGVTISNNLKWSNHINTITKSANSTLAFVRRNIKTSNRTIKDLAYKTLVRPKLEYAATVWDPYTIKDKHQIEMVQRRAARWVTHRYHNTSSVTDMLKDLGWVTLEERRRQARLIMMHKILQNLVAISSHPIRYAINSKSRLAHQASLCQLHTKSDGHKYSYYPRTIIDWNNLPAATATARDIETFKRCLRNPTSP